MGILGSCLATGTIKYKGSIIFKPFNLSIIKPCKNQELERNLDNVKKTLIEAEEIRIIIVEAYKYMLDVTGAVVLETPDLVNCIKSFRVSFLTEINKSLMGNKNIDYNQVKKELNLISLFKFSLFPPFYNEDKDEAIKLRKILSLSIDSNEKLSNERKAICKYLITLNKYKEYLQDLYKLLARLIDEATEFKSQFFYSTRKEDIINEKEEQLLSKKNISLFNDYKDQLKKINDELAKLVKDFDEYILIKYNEPNEFEELESISHKAMEKKTNNLKVIIWNYFQGDKIKSIDDWESNYIYQDDESEINMNSI